MFELCAWFDIWSVHIVDLLNVVFRQSIFMYFFRLQPRPSHWPPWKLASRASCRANTGKYPCLPSVFPASSVLGLGDMSRDDICIVARFKLNRKLINLIKPTVGETYQSNRCLSAWIRRHTTDNKFRQSSAGIYGCLSVNLVGALNADVTIGLRAKTNYVHRPSNG